MDYPKLSEKEREEHIKSLTDQMLRIEKELDHYQSEINDEQRQKYLDKARSYQGRCFKGFNRDCLTNKHVNEEYIYIYSVHEDEFGRVSARVICVTDIGISESERMTILMPEIRKVMKKDAMLRERSWIINKDYDEISVADFIAKYEEVASRIDEHINRLCMQDLQSEE